MSIAGLDRLRRGRDAGDQPAAADRNHQHVEIGLLLQHLQRDGALPRDDMRIVVGMHPDQAALARFGLGARLRLADGLAVEQHLGAIRLGRRHLHERRRHRHHDGRGDAETRRMVGDRLGVVAGRHGDDAARALGRRQRGELGAGAALLERVGDLEIFVFDEHLGAGQRRQPRRRQHRRAQHMAGDDAPGGFDVGKGDGQWISLQIEAPLSSI